MAYLKVKRVKGRSYYQIVEAYREGGQKRERMLLHLGTDLVSPHSLLRWWNYLGKPIVPYKPGCPIYKGTPSLATPCEKIVDLIKFLEAATEEDRTLAAEGLKFLLS